MQTTPPEAVARPVHSLEFKPRAVLSKKGAEPQARRPVIGCWIAALFLGAVLQPCVAAGDPAEPPARNLGDLSLEQLMEIPVDTVFSASRYEQKTTRAPAAVTIVAADEIAAFGHRTVADVLRSVRGLYVSDDSNYSYLGVRGFLRPGDYNTRVLVLLDGHRMNDNIYDSAYFGHEELVDVEAIERVEFVRGPSSSIYGTSAFFGVVNLVTKTGAQIDGAEVSGDAGTYGTYRGRLNYGRRLPGDGDLFLSLSYYDSRGRGRIYYPEFDPRISPAPGAANDGIAQNSDAERAVNVLGKLKLSDFTVSAFWSSRMKQVPTASFVTVFNDGRERTDDDRGYVDVRYDHDLSAGVHLEGRAYWDYYGYFGTYPENAGDPAAPAAVALSKDRAVGRWAGAEALVTARLGRRHTLIVGGEFRRNLQQRQLSYYQDIPDSTFVDSQRSGRTFALYAQDELALRPDLLLNAGLRYDDYSDSFGGTLNPRLALIYSPAQRTTVKVLYGQAFRAPNAYERFYYPNPAGDILKPERINTTEVVVEHDLASHYRLSASIYRYNVRDLISQTPAADGTFYFANVDRATATGAECEVEGHFAAGLRARASYAFQRSEDEATHAELTNSPRHLAKLGVICPFARERLVAGLELQYEGAVRTLSGGEARDFLLGNLTLTAPRLPGGVELSASVYNLFDTRYGYPGAADHLQDVLPQPGRTFRLKLTRKF